MRAIRAAAGLALAAGLLLSGCSDGDPDGDDGGGDGGGGGFPGAVVSPLAEESTGPRAEFLSAIEETEFESWAVDGPSDDEIAQFPDRWCRAAAVGHSVVWMLEGDGADELYPVGWEWGTTLQDARRLVIMGIMTHCPEHQDDAMVSLREGTVEY